MSGIDLGIIVHSDELVLAGKRARYVPLAGFATLVNGLQWFAQAQPVLNFQ